MLLTDRQKMPKNIRKTIILFLAVLLTSGMFSVTSADKQKPLPDPDPLSGRCINGQCTITLDRENMHRNRLTDDLRTTSVPVRKDYGFTIELPDNILHGGVLFLEWTIAADFSLCFYDDTGVELGREENPYLMLEQAYPLPDTCVQIRLTAKTGGRLSGLYVYATEADTPDRVVRWVDPAGKTDLLFVVTHSDDETVMMGGILPTYAGERGYRVQVAYMSTKEPIRCFEALAALTANHAYRYPRFLGVFDDEKTKDDRLALVRLIRETCPDVIVTHDLKGEYGKNTHIRTAKAVTEAYALASDPAYDPESAITYGVWQVKKLYLHLYEENDITLDFDTPLDSFGGKTAFEAAAESFTCYRSQRIEWLDTLLSNTYDCRKYGLYATTVGPDIEKNDFFEHIKPEA